MQGALQTRVHITLCGIAGLFFILDRVCKYVAQSQRWDTAGIVGFEYFENTGIAFSLPVPLGIVIVVTPLVLVTLLHLAHRFNQPLSWLGWYLIFVGAISNLIDRMVYGFVIDYIRIGTGVINLADILVCVGIMLLLYKQKKPKH